MKTIDYSITLSFPGSDYDYAKIGEVYDQLKKLAAELGCVVVIPQRIRNDVGEISVESLGESFSKINKCMKMRSIEPVSDPQIKIR